MLLGACRERRDLAAFAARRGHLALARSTAWRARWWPRSRRARVTRRRHRGAGQDRAGVCLVLDRALWPSRSVRSSRSRRRLGGIRAAFVASAAAVALALGVGVVAPVGSAHGTLDRASDSPTSRAIRASGPDGWRRPAGSSSRGRVHVLSPLAQARGFHTGAGIGLVFLVLGLANTAARFPAGWAVDRTGRCTPYAIAGLVTASVVTALLPYVEGLAALLALAALFGGVSGVAFVAISTALATSATPAARGIVMGGYSTSLYLGLGLGSFALGPVITHHGYGAGFVAGAGAGVLGAALAAALWTRARAPQGQSGSVNASRGAAPRA